MPKIRTFPIWLTIALVIAWFSLPPAMRSRWVNHGSNARLKAALGTAINNNNVFAVADAVNAGADVNCHLYGAVTPLLRVHYNFYWQRSYRLATPLPLKAGTELQAVGWYDNSAGNPHNPDPTAAVHWGDQTTDEMMVGFFDVAVPASLDKWKYFGERKPGGS